jgi:hypothetical protein
MREICKSGSMSGDGRRGHGRIEAPPSRESGWQQLLPRPTATAPILDSTEARLTFLVNSPISLRLNPMRSARQSCAAFTLLFRNDP